MALACCPACEGASSEDVLQIAALPIVHVVAPGSRRPVAPLRIVACVRCGHLYNADFDRDRADEIYGGPVATNAPVHISMSAALKEVADWIGGDAIVGKRALEIGGGSGHLALILAQSAGSVVLAEPGPTVFAEAPVGNIRVLPTTFPVAGLQEQFDLIVCRQVLEHVAAPVAFLQQIVARMAPDGVLYLEVPRAEYVIDNASLVDFHYPHVQYFRHAVLAALFSRCGLRVLRSQVVKNGHDVGYLLGAGESTADGPAPIGAAALARRLEARRKRGAEQSAGAGRIALYGACAYSQTILALYGDHAAIDLVFDDTPAYRGFCAYSPHREIAVAAPSSEALRPFATVIITAYLHDEVIGARLRQLGFRGRVRSVRADAAAGQGTAPLSLFADAG